MIRPDTDQGRAVLAARCAAYAAGTRDALAAAVDGLRALPDGVDAHQAADQLAAAAPGLLAIQRQLFAEQAGVEL